MQERSAFRQVADESSRGRTGTVIYMCPKCFKVVRSTQAQVNGFNEWSFKQTYEYDSNTGRSRFVYTSVDYDGRGCCF